jgi:hypothetical protein
MKIIKYSFLTEERMYNEMYQDEEPHSYFSEHNGNVSVNKIDKISYFEKMVNEFNNKI